MISQYDAVARLRASLLLEPDQSFVHLYPPWDKKQHVLGPRGTPCWCNPYIDEIDRRIVVHSPSH